MAQPFRSFFMGGFECATHRRPDGVRLDLSSATGHASLVETDYRVLGELGIRTVRDGLRWHLIETTPGSYDWSSLLPMLRAAQRTGTQVIWDMAHYGWPDDLDIWSPAFLERFAAYVAAAVRVIRDHQDEAPILCPVNEISFWSWAGGEVGLFNPVGHGRGAELKEILVRAAMAGIDAARSVDPAVRFIYAEPLINVAGERAHEVEAAERYRVSQFEAWDMLSGRFKPELGGNPQYLDILGVNYYYNNQWTQSGRPLGHFDPLYQPFREMLVEVGERYGRPLIIAETGIEGRFRPEWLSYVAAETRAAMDAGVDVQGLCIYPVTEYPGWSDDRHCPTGLLQLPEGNTRPVFAPLARELAVQQQLFASARTTVRPLRLNRSV